MGKFLNHSDQKGFCEMNNKWKNLGKPRKTVGGKKTVIPDKQKTFKAK